MIDDPKIDEDVKYLNLLVYWTLPSSIVHGPYLSIRLLIFIFIQIPMFVVKTIVLILEMID